MRIWDPFRKLWPEARQQVMVVWTGMETVEMEKENLYKVDFGVRPGK